MNIPEGAEILAAGGRGGTGNVLLLFRGGPQPRVLKLYRCRRSRLREALRRFSCRFLERKLGGGAAARCRTERRLLRHWKAEGFDVIACFDDAAPPGVRGPALWLEYCVAPNLRDVVSDPRADGERKRSALRRLGEAMSRRHQRARRNNDPLLVHEHGNINHFFLCGERVVAFDLENAFRPGYPVLEAIGQELAGVARSIERADPGHAAGLLESWVEGYEDRSLLREAALHMLRGRGLGRRLRRWFDTATRPGKSKTAAMEHVQRLI
jgi:hypothetical protein